MAAVVCLAMPHRREKKEREEERKPKERDDSAIAREKSKIEGEGIVAGPVD